MSEKMADFNTIDDFDIENKTVLVRVDINAPVDPSSGIILDDTRLKLHARTIKELSNKGAKVVILAHQSRPGKKDFTTLSQSWVLSLQNVAENNAFRELNELTGTTFRSKHYDFY